MGKGINAFHLMMDVNIEHTQRQIEKTKESIQQTQDCLEALTHYAEPGDDARDDRRDAQLFMNEQWKLLQMGN